MAVTRRSPDAASRASTASSKRDKTRDPRNRRATERSGSGDAAVPEGRAFETLLRSDPELLRSLVDQAADALCLHQIDGRILDVNRRMCTTLGYSREELLALSVLDIDVNASVDETAQAAARLVPGVPMTGERVLRRKDGSMFPIELSLSLIVSGRKRLMLGMARDITDRKRAEQAQEKAQRALEERVRERTQHLEVVNRRLEEEIRGRQRSEAALRESEERFRTLAERSLLLAWEADARTWQFTYVGPQAPDVLGYPVEEWYRPDFWVDHLHPDDRGRIIDTRRQQAATAVDYELEYRMLAADGHLVWFQDVVHVIRGDEGPRTLRGFMIDITARKRAVEARQLLVRGARPPGQEHAGDGASGGRADAAHRDVAGGIRRHVPRPHRGAGPHARGDLAKQGHAVAAARAGGAVPGGLRPRERARLDRWRRGADPSAIGRSAGAGAARAGDQRRQARRTLGDVGKRALDVAPRRRSTVPELARVGWPDGHRAGASRVRLDTDQGIDSLRARRLGGPRVRPRRSAVHDRVPLHSQLVGAGAFLTLNISPSPRSLTTSPPLAS